MLVLSRKHLQSVVVGGANGVGVALKVTVLEIRGDLVKLGFEADPDLAIHRSEVWERIFAADGSDSAKQIDSAPVA